MSRNLSLRSEQMGGADDRSFALQTEKGILAPAACGRSSRKEHEGTQLFIYVADFSRMEKFEGVEKVFYSAANAGFIGQNVYLFCASQGLATVVCGAIDRAALANAMSLRPEQKITLAQTVGCPEK